MTDNSPPTAPDIQDPLPEANWLWRRVFSIGATVIILAILIGLAIATNRIVGTVVERIDTMTSEVVAQIAKQALVVILQMFRLMFWALIVVVTYYMIAPSAEQITKMLQTAGLLKAGVQLAGRSVETPDRREIATTAGKPPQPVSPPVEGGEPTLPGEMPPISSGNAPSGNETGSGATQVAEGPETGAGGLPSDIPPLPVENKGN